MESLATRGAHCRSRFRVAAAVLICSVANASAADIAAPSSAPPAIYTPAPPAPYNWSGFYLGANSGWGFATGNSSGSITGGALAGASGNGSSQFNGAIVGGQVGVNWQIGSAVVGVEADMQWSGQSTTSSDGCGVGCSLSETAKIPWFATVRGRVGGAFDRILVYGTGGLAISNATDTVSATALGATVNLVNLNATNIGWTGGAGAEVALSKNWSAKIEYLYVQTNFSASGPIAIFGGTATERGTIKDSIVRTGFNFRFPTNASPY